jgi:hypothetical protein
MIAISLLKDRIITPQTGTKLNHLPQSVSILPIAAVWHCPAEHRRGRARPPEPSRRPPSLHYNGSPLSLLCPECRPNSTNLRRHDPRHSRPRRPSPTSPPDSRCFADPARHRPRNGRFRYLAGRTHKCFQLFPETPGSIAEKTRRRAGAHALSTACNRRPRPSTPRAWRENQSPQPRRPTRVRGPAPREQTPLGQTAHMAVRCQFAEHVMDGAAIETRCGSDEATDDQPSKQLYHATFRRTPEPPRVVKIRPPCCS